MALSSEERAARARQRMIDSAKKYQTSTYRGKVATVFQRMIRAEWGCDPRPYHTAITDAGPYQVFRTLGDCVCVTCGKVGPWTTKTKGMGGMHAGHFLASRRNSILFEESNVAPQCSYCNYTMHGRCDRFRQWMELVRGASEIERLERLKQTTVSFTIEQLVDKAIEYRRRLKAAEEKMAWT